MHVCLNIQDPTQRWVERRYPAINPAFAAAELIVLLNGSDDARILNAWNPALQKYQGNYANYPGAYGKRLCSSFGFDQLNRAFEALAGNCESRQIVLQIWKPDIDLPQNNGMPNNNDIPCNVCSLLKVRDGKLLWTQIMRSNDIAFGLPYDIVQFTSLQEIFAGWLNIEVGEYMHISDSLHMYESNRCSISTNQDVHTNTDRFTLGKKESDIFFKELYLRMQELSNQKCTESLVLEIISKKTMPNAYHNLLMLLCEYIAYKQKMNVDIISRCDEKQTNKQLRSMMRLWMDARNKNDATTDWRICD